MFIKIKPETPEIGDMYKNHGHFYPGDSGLDLFFVETVEVPGHARSFKLKLGIKCEPDRSYFMVPRSSITKTPLRMANSIGVIDAGYRGELIACVDNNDPTGAPFVVEKGTRLFQILDFSNPDEPIKFEIVDELGDSVRGERGFGSSNEAPGASTERGFGSSNEAPGASTERGFGSSNDTEADTN